MHTRIQSQGDEETTYIRIGGTRPRKQQRHFAATQSTPVRVRGEKLDAVAVKSTSS